MIRILFVCHGNICRSPMAEFMFRDMTKNRHIEDQFEIASAATSTEEIWNGVGNPVYPPAREELLRHGIRCEGKRARQVTKADYAHYDYLLCADTMNIRNTKRIVGEDTEGKIHLMLDYTSRSGQSISDPWYSGDFEKTYQDIEEGLEGFLSYLGYSVV